MDCGFFGRILAKAERQHWWAIDQSLASCGVTFEIAYLGRADDPYAKAWRIPNSDVGKLPHGPDPSGGGESAYLIILPDGRQFPVYALLDALDDEARGRWGRSDNEQSSCFQTQKIR